MWQEVVGVDDAGGAVGLYVGPVGLVVRWFYILCLLTGGTGTGGSTAVLFIELVVRSDCFLYWYCGGERGGGGRGREEGGGVGEEEGGWGEGGGRGG